MMIFCWVYEKEYFVRLFYIDKWVVIMFCAVFISVFISIIIFADCFNDSVFLFFFWLLDTIVLNFGGILNNEDRFYLIFIIMFYAVLCSWSRFWRMMYWDLVSCVSSPYWYFMDVNVHSWSNLLLSNLFSFDIFGFFEWCLLSLYFFLY